MIRCSHRCLQYRRRKNYPQPGTTPGDSDLTVELLAGQSLGCYNSLTVLATWVVFTHPQHCVLRAYRHQSGGGTVNRRAYLAAGNSGHWAVNVVLAVNFAIHGVVQSQ